jgi:hypothetical protein
MTHPGLLVARIGNGKVVRYHFVSGPDGLCIAPRGFFSTVVQKCHRFDAAGTVNPAATHVRLL